MNIYAISAISASVILLAIGFFVFQKNPSNKVYRLFLISNTVIALWLFGCFGESHIIDEKYLYIWDKFLNIFAVFSPTLFVHIIFSIVNAKDSKYVKMCYLISSVLAISVFTPLYAQGIRSYYGVRFITIPGPLYYFFIGFLGWCGYLTISRTIYAVNNDKRNSNKFKYLLFSVVTIIVAASTYYVMILNVIILPIDNWLNVLYGATMAYAITRYRLMDIDLIIRKSAVILSATLVFSFIYLSLILASQFIFESLFGAGYSFWMAFPAVFVISLFFKPISDAIQYYVIKIFFRRKFAADTIAARFSDNLKELIEIDKIGDYITRSAVKVFRIKGSACYILDKKCGGFKCVSARGDMKRLKGAVEKHNILISGIQESHKAVIKDELLQITRNNEGREKQKALELTGVMDHLGCAICVPSFISKGGAGLVGFLLGSDREKEYLFNSEDIDLLENFASQAAVSINNAFMYEARLEEIERSMDSSKFADIGATAAGVAHEAKNALGSIYAFAQMLEAKKDDKKFLEEHVDMVANEVERMRILMEGVVNYSAPEEADKKREDVKALIGETIVLVRDQAKSKDIAIEADFAGGKFINVNKNSLKQVFLNLFINALDAMGKGGKLMIYALESENNIVVRVADTGCGIPDSKLEKIFEPFFSTKPQGTGLGLAIIKKAVSANGGTISVKSEVGTGTVFELVFGKA